VEEKQDQGWEAYLISVMFHPIRGPRMSCCPSCIGMWRWHTTPP
jgi:hypothetical protein